MVEISRRARLAVYEIWDWNDRRYGASHADRYTDSLREWILNLDGDPIPGLSVKDDPALRYAVFRQGQRRHGHVAVFRIEADKIRITDIFHTAQNWRAKLEDA